MRCALMVALASCIFGTCGAAVRSETTPQKQEISRSVARTKSTTASRSISQSKQPTTTGRQPSNTVVPRTTSTSKTRTAEINSSRQVIQPEKTSLSRSTVPTRSIQQKPNNTRATATKILTRATVQQPSKELLDAQSDLLSYCQTQYDNCMDEYCNRLDENMGRCSCSNNINNYSKTADALKETTYALQDIAQQIQYIGLSAKEIETLFSETEAEATLSLNSDTSQLKNDLDKIKGMIIDVKSPKSSFALTDGLSTDLSGLIDFDIDGTTLDLDSIFSNNASSISSISNQRGASLYSTAVSHCRANILSSCKKQGINETTIINTYDLKIDRDCLKYEKSLTEQNKTMKATIRNAENVLRKARLMVKQNANTYDLQGCVAALDECMRSEFVCDENYQNCLDPSGKYIANASIVVGSKPQDGLYSAWGDNGSRPWDSNQTMAKYVDAHLWKQKPSGQASNNIADFLQYKIGYNDGKNNVGLCMGVLNQCQDLTYSKSDSTKSYIYNNTVIKEWLIRVLPMIKKAQDNMLNTYGQNCANDVKDCLTTNGYSFNDPSKNTIATAICAPITTTCYDITSPETPSNKFIMTLFAASCEPGKYLNDEKECVACDGATYTQTEDCSNEIKNAKAATKTIAYKISGNAGGGGDITSCLGTKIITGGQCEVTSCISDDYTLEGNTCIKQCEAGTYKKSEDVCEICPIGTYTDKTNQTECTPCGPGKTTENIGSGSVDQCIDIVCESGQYLNGSTCEQCPDGADASDAGATKPNQCYKQCSAINIEHGTATPVPGKQYYNGSTYPNCVFIPNCEPGYLGSGKGTSSPSCSTPCPQGSFCNNGMETKCNPGFTTDGTGAIGSNDCKRDCTTDDISGSTEVTGTISQTGENTCSALTCQTGWKSVTAANGTQRCQIGDDECSTNFFALTNQINTALNRTGELNRDTTIKSLNINDCGDFINDFVAKLYPPADGVTEEVQSLATWSGCSLSSGTHDGTQYYNAQNATRTISSALTVGGMFATLSPDCCATSNDLCPANEITTVIINSYGYQTPYGRVTAKYGELLPTKSTGYATYNTEMTPPDPGPGYVFDGIGTLKGTLPGLIPDVEIGTYYYDKDMKPIKEWNSNAKAATLFARFHCDSGYTMQNHKCISNQPTCEAGQYIDSNNKCTDCPINNYCPEKSTTPTPCTNAPANAQYTDTKVKTSDCPWECEDGYKLSGSTCVADCNGYNIGSGSFACADPSINGTTKSNIDLSTGVTHGTAPALTGNGAWGVTFSYGDVTGVATCNPYVGDGDYAATPNTGFSAGQTTGNYCWCRMTSPRKSRWVYHSMTSTCARSCAAACMNAVQGDATMRTSLYKFEEN